jgi:hypothetical protein
MKKNNAISRLRFKLIAVSMAVTLLILGLIVGGINFINFKKVIDNADTTIDYLANNYNTEETRPEPPDEEGGGDGFRPFDDGISPEVKFESRYFVVSFDGEGNVASSDTKHVFAVSEEDSIKIAKKIYEGSSDRGFYRNYRYAKISLNGYNAVMCLDVYNGMSSANYFLLVSLSASFIGWITVIIIVLAFSKRIIAPVSKSYEKQKRFISDAGHEIKTPLAIIEADIGVMEINEGENEWLDDIKTQVRRLARLTNDLIHLSKLDEGKDSLKFIDFSVSDLAKETVTSFTGLATVNNKKLEANIQPNLTLKGDTESIRELLTILLDNAIKYSTGDGNISLEVKKKNGHIVIEASNSAKNLTKENAEHLFDRFYRADESRNSETGGHGIGLSMAKAIVEAHKGKISAEVTDDGELNIKAVL